MPGQRSEVANVGDVSVTQWTPGGVEEFFGDRTSYNVEGKEFETLSDALDYAQEKAEQ